VPDRYTYEIESTPTLDKGFVVLVHRYPPLGRVTTEDLEFATFKELVEWLSETVNVAA
jgi:hypothetical protein